MTGVGRCCLVSVADTRVCMRRRCCYLTPHAVAPHRWALQEGVGGRVLPRVPHETGGCRVGAGRCTPFMGSGVPPTGKLVHSALRVWCAALRARCAGPRHGRLVRRLREHLACEAINQVWDGWLLTCLHTQGCVTGDAVGAACGVVAKPMATHVRACATYYIKQHAGRPGNNCAPFYPALGRKLRKLFRGPWAARSNGFCATVFLLAVRGSSAVPG